MNEIILSTVSGMADLGRTYRGVLYAGLMLTKDGPYVLEFNARFGDPETQCLMPRMECDLAEVLLAAAQGTLEDVKVEWKKEACICVVLASKGYPEHPETGKEILGLEQAAKYENVHIFHAGTSFEDGKLLTSAGRVLSVVCTDPHLSDAYDKVYQVISEIQFEGMQYRKDIGKKALDSFKH